MTHWLLGLFLMVAVMGYCSSDDGAKLANMCQRQLLLVDVSKVNIFIYYIYQKSQLRTQLL